MFAREAIGAYTRQGSKYTWNHMNMSSRWQGTEDNRNACRVLFWRQCADRMCVLNARWAQISRVTRIIKLAVILIFKNVVTMSKYCVKARETKIVRIYFRLFPSCWKTLKKKFIRHFFFFHFAINYRIRLSQGNMFASTPEVPGFKLGRGRWFF